MQQELYYSFKLKEAYKDHAWEQRTQVSEAYKEGWKVRLSDMRGNLCQFITVEGSHDQDAL